MIGALLIPILSAVTQWINVKLMPQQSTAGNDQASSMAQSMKVMNMLMPVVSAWFCFTLPAGMGLYWVAGSVVRSIQQVVINKHIDKMDFDDIIKKNSAKSAKKLEKMQEAQKKMNAYANMNTSGLCIAACVVIDSLFHSVFLLILSHGDLKFALFCMLRVLIFA